MKKESQTFDFHGVCDTMLSMIQRILLEQSIRQALARSRGVVLIGPRQAGKSTLAQAFVPPTSSHYFDLEYPPHVKRLENPVLALESLQGLVVIDEVQRQPELFPLLRVLMDRANTPGQFLLLGSASPDLMRQSGESLLGRIEMIEVGGFDAQEVAVQPNGWQGKKADQLWLRGGFPRSFLALDDAASMAWRHGAIQNHVQLDLPQFGLNAPAPAMLRFWNMLAHYHGQTFSAAPLAQSMGVSEPTIRRYLDLLTQTLMVRQLPPWFENVGKRQVKAPKIYFRDSGFLHTLLGIQTKVQLHTHPASGASWEGFALEQVLRIAKPDQAYFWATHQGAELDLLMLKGSQRIGVEFKRTTEPRLTPSMRIATHDLKLDALYVVYPGEHRYPIASGVEAVPLWGLLNDTAF
jgi:predicted AAA+ superfamily ATPase